LKNRDFEYDGMYDFFFQKSIRKRLKRQNFNQDLYDSLIQKRQNLISSRVDYELEKRGLDVLGGLLQNEENKEDQDDDK